MFPLRRSHASSRKASGDHDRCLKSGGRWSRNGGGDAWVSSFVMGMEDGDRHNPWVLGLCGGRGTSHDGLENDMALLGFFLSALLNAKGHHNLYDQEWIRPVR